MPKLLNTKDPDFERLFSKFLHREGSKNRKLIKTVSSILESVRRDGDRALIKLTETHDNFFLSEESISFSDDEIKSQITLVSPTEKKALQLAADRIRSYHEKQVPQDALWADDLGARVGWAWRPIAKVGLYVPGGTASYPSSVLMGAIPAVVAYNKFSNDSKKYLQKLENFSKRFLTII